MKTSMIKSALLAILFAVAMASVFTACKDHDEQPVEDTVEFSRIDLRIYKQQVGMDVEDVTITIPYEKALGTEEYTVKVAVSGVGAAGITVADKSVKLTAGSGQIVLDVTGKPTTAGAVTFTINGIPRLTSNTVSAEVDAAEVSFGNPTFEATVFKAMTAIVGGKVSVPYFNADGTEKFTISVTPTGTGSLGINEIKNAERTLTAGNGNIEFDITGTPQQAGPVTFKVNGITRLNNSTIDATVEEAPAARFAVGDYYPAGATKDNAVGVVFWINPDDATKGKIVSMDESGDIKWSTENTVIGTTEDKGAENTKKIQEASSYSAAKYPAVAWCVAKGEGWYLPCVEESSVLCTAWNQDRDGFNAKLTTPIGAYGYWSSSEYYDGTNIRYIYFDNGNGSVYAKSSSHPARAIKVF